MTEADRLERAFVAGRLLPPRSTVPTTVDLARAMGLLAGVEEFRDDPGARKIADLVGEADHLVFALIDGLGIEALEARPPTCFLRHSVAMELRAVFPSTTAAALTSLATGRWPGAHAVLSWWTYLPEYDLTATILPFTERFGGQPLARVGVDPGQAFPEPPFLGRVRRDMAAVLPRSLADGVFTRYAHAARPVLPYEKLAEAADAIIARVRTASAPSFTYLYFSGVDAAAHDAGPRSTDHTRQIDLVARELEHLAVALAGRARLVASSDHGLIEVTDAAKILLAAGDPLMQLLHAPPHGEPRVPFFRVRAGDHDRFAELFSSRFGPSHMLLTTQEAEALELFGPGSLSPRARARIGDFLAIPEGPTVLMAAGPDPVVRLRGFHGGLNPEEMRIPLLLA